MEDFNLGAILLENARKNNEKVRKEGAVKPTKEELRAYNAGEFPNTPNYEKRCRLEALRERTQ